MRLSRWVCNDAWGEGKDKPAGRVEGFGTMGLRRPGGSEG